MEIDVDMSDSPLSPAEEAMALRIGPVREPWEHYFRTLLMAEDAARELMVLMARREPERDYMRGFLLQDRLKAVEHYARCARLLWNAADLLCEELDLKDEGVHEGVKFQLRLMDHYPTTYHQEKK